MNAPAPGGTGEIRALTGVRAYAAAWVMLLHLPFSVGVIPHVQLGAIAAHGAWGVDLFFVLSGFILSLLYVPRFQSRGLAAAYRNYLAARFARIYPLHLATLALLAAYFVTRRLLEGEAPGGFGLRALAMNVTLLHGWGYVDRLTWNYPSWSISAEWFAYLLLTPALALGLRRVGAWSCVMIAMGLWSLLFSFASETDQSIREMTISWAIPRITAEFTLGYALYRIYALVRLTPALADATVAAGLIGLLALCFLPREAEWFLAPALACIILGLARSGPLGSAVFGNRFAVFWGERSYSIYMLHAVVQILSSMALIHLDMRTLPPAAAWALFLALIGIVLLGSHLAYQWIEVPLRTRLRAVLERRPPAAAPASASLLST